MPPAAPLTVTRPGEAGVGPPTAMDLTPLLAPRSVAVVGASPRPGTYGNQTLENLVAAGFEGPVWGVHPTARAVHGIACYPLLADLPEAPDCVVIATPAATVPGLLSEAIDAGARSAVVFAAGFAETPSGVELQRRLRSTALAAGLPVCGPNGDGIVSLHDKAPLWGDAFLPATPGPVAVVSQSGNIAVNALNAGHGLRLHTVVSCGNQAVVQAADYLDALAGRNGVRSVALYLEDAGDGAALASALARCAEHDVGVAVLVAGQSARGAAAVAAHTGALAGNDRVLRALVEDAGAAWATTPHDLLELAKTLGMAPKSRRRSGGAVGIITCSGGDAAVAADIAARIGVPLADLDAATGRRLQAVLTDAATLANPLDYTAQLFGLEEPLAEIVDAVGSDPGVGSVIFYYDEAAQMPDAMDRVWRATRDGVVLGAGRSGTPTLLAATLPELQPHSSAEDMYEAGLTPVSGISEALQCAAALLVERADPGRLREISAAASPRTPGHWVPEHVAKQLLRAAGVDVPEGTVVDSSDAAVSAADRLGGPVAMKLSAPDLQHKAVEAAVLLGLTGPAAVRAAYTELRSLVRWRHAVVLVEEMAGSGPELFVSVRRDTTVGVLVLGAGGSLTEVIDDTVVVPLPVDGARVRAALGRLRTAKWFVDADGAVPAAVVDLVLAVAQLTVDEDLALLELNPVVVGPHRAVALDAVARRAAAGE